MGAVRHHNQDINVLIVVAPSQVPRPSCELGNLTRWHPIWVVAQIQMQEMLFMAFKNSKASHPPTVASSKAVTANCMSVSTAI